MTYQRNSHYYISIRQILDKFASYLTSITSFLVLSKTSAFQFEALVKPIKKAAEAFETFYLGTLSSEFGSQLTRLYLD